MSDYQQVFARYEKKYMLSESQRAGLSGLIAGRTQPDRFGRTEVCSIYYDTPSRQIIRASLEKPIYKEKLRLRSYGVPPPGGRVFVELKKKYRGMVFKRREAMTLEQGQSYLSGAAAPPERTQIIRETDAFLDFYGPLEPSMAIFYNRTAIVSAEDPALRITFDSRILARGRDLTLASGVYGRPLLEDGYSLMEIKTAGALPPWLAAALDRLEIRPCSFSKYGTAYLASLGASEPEKRSVLCA